MLEKILDLAKINKRAPSTTITDEVSQLYHQLNMIKALDIAQSLMYAKQTTFEFHSKAGKELAKLLLDNSVRRKKMLMQMDSGELTLNIEENFFFNSKFYKGLYQSQKLTGFFGNLKLSELSSEHLEILKAPIGLSEIQKAITKLRCNSSSGLGGLTSEFYKCFVHVLANPLQVLFNQCIVDGTIPPTWLRS